MFTEMLGGPNNWAESDGAFTSQYESPEMEQALSQVAALWKAGVFHPDSFAAGIFPKAFDAGHTVLEYGTFDPGVRYLLNAPSNPDYRIGFIIEPKFDGGGTAVARLGAGFYGFTGISKKAKGRVEELLRVLNWCGAPLGSQEALLAKYGIAGRDYTLKDGILTATPTAASETLVLGYLSYPPYVYFPTNPAVVPVYRAMHDALATQYATTVADPSLGLYSPTSYTPAATTSTKTLNDVINDVIQGRKDLDGWRSAVASWKKAAGDKIAAEYAAAR
jgi:putative aldouronate transport system substrate-binding protein